MIFMDIENKITWTEIHLLGGSHSKILIYYRDFMCFVIVVINLYILSYNLRPLCLVAVVIISFTTVHFSSQSNCTIFSSTTPLFHLCFIIAICNIYIVHIFFFKCNIQNKSKNYMYLFKCFEALSQEFSWWNKGYRNLEW